MKDYQSLSHVKWDCKYHIIWIPKYRRKKLYGLVRRRFGEIIKELCRQKGVILLEGHAMSDHVDLCLSIPPKYSVSHVVGFLKGKSTIRLNKEFMNRKNGSTSFWARGYFASTVGLDEQIVRQYINHQEENEKRQLEIDFNND